MFCPYSRSTKRRLDLRSPRALPLALRKDPLSQRLGWYRCLTGSRSSIPGQLIELTVARSLDVARSDELVGYDLSVVAGTRRRQIVSIRHVRRIVVTVRRRIADRCRLRTGLFPTVPGESRSPVSAPRPLRRPSRPEELLPAARNPANCDERFSALANQALPNPDSELSYVADLLARPLLPPQGHPMSPLPMYLDVA